jgi:hypothetical protein
MKRGARLRMPDGVNAFIAFQRPVNAFLNTFFFAQSSNVCVDI